MKLQGKRALITGAAQGIGRAAALVFAREGARLALLDINEEGVEAIASQAATSDSKAVAIRCDVTDEPQVESAVQRAIAEMGGLDILLNTAAWLDPPIPVHEMPLAVWDRAITTDLTSVFLCSKHALRAMIAQGSGGTVISLSSVAGRRGRANRASYGAAKAAIINLTESMALEAAAFGINVNCICPVGVAGDRALNIQRQLAELQGRSIEEGEREYEASKDRLVTEEQVAELCLFLASPEAKRITGQAIGIG